ncbi:hypothetical protein SAMN05880590_1052 [Rhizobium sp. RU35A]|uniref:MarR family transcriptional regulator n=1 Tax=Rhizobium sp. RU35A TaxID=1907414 RepID=UPI000953C05B|nr:helix-turn-helix domain-containing protein [Rhizobium sp. RU35A]SIQ52499.1 hypothetical protein SAMN05880590_1052 [Rhizobium sp. RU35A]
MATVQERIKERIAEQPGLTESELARSIFGMDGYQQRVNSTCRLLVAKGEIERRGNGGPSDPYTYHFPAAK